MSFAARTEEHDVKKRISTLFGKVKEESETGEKEEEELKLDEAYETVNEGLTSDTTEMADGHKEFKRENLEASFGEKEKEETV